MNGFDLRKYHILYFIGKFLLKFHMVKSVSRRGDLNYGSQKRVTFVFVSYSDKISGRYIKK
jgi:hypothetical protein